MGREVDSQRKRFYRWERQVWREAIPQDMNNKMSLSEANAFVGRVWNDYIPTDHQLYNNPPKVEFGKEGSCYARGGLFTIILPPWARIAPVVLHEVGHSLQSVLELWQSDEARAIRRPAHGAGFATFYMDLMVRYLHADEAKAKIAAEGGKDPWGVKTHYVLQDDGSYKKTETPNFKTRRALQFAPYPLIPQPAVKDVVAFSPADHINGNEAAPWSAVFTDNGKWTNDGGWASWKEVVIRCHKCGRRVGQIKNPKVGKTYRKKCPRKTCAGINIYTHSKRQED